MSRSKVLRNATVIVSYVQRMITVRTLIKNNQSHCLLKLYFPGKLWKGPFRQSKGRHYAIRSFPKLKLNNESVMRLLLCWKYPEAARKVVCSPTFFPSFTLFLIFVFLRG